jgi:hypothetical protein
MIRVFKYEMGGAYGTNWERAGERRVVVKKPAEQRPL